MSYGTANYDLHRRAMSYIDRILRGAKPGDLLVQYPTKFDLAINLKIAKALGLTLSPTLLAGADEGPKRRSWDVCYFAAVGG